MSEISSLNLKPEQIKTDPDSLQFYGKDWTTYYEINASGIVFPESTADVVQIVLWARKHKVGLVPSGGRTGLSGAACALNGELVVSFEKMNHILSINETESSVEVEPGVITLYRMLRAFYLHLGPFTRKVIATIDAKLEELDLVPAGDFT